MSSVEKKSGEGKAQISEVRGKGRRQKNAASWVIEVRNAFCSQNETWQASMWDKSKKVCIYRVPKSIESCKQYAYNPSVVSLGPYRYNFNPVLSAMDQQKQLAVKKLLKRIPMEGKSLSEKFDALTKMIESSDEKIRKHYDEAIAWDKETLSTMIATDACFIRQFFHLRYPIPARGDIMNDIMKLQNQIPLFVLKDILKYEYQSEDEAEDELCSLLEENIMQQPFSGEMVSRSSLQNYIEVKNPSHLLDLQRMVLVDLLKANNECKNVPQPGCGQQLSSGLIDKYNSLWQGIFGGGPKGSEDNVKSASSNVFFPGAKLLRKTGIKFQNGPIGFHESGKFCLPEIIVDDNTEILLRNIMAYEECQLCSRKSMEPVISQYVCLLDDLIESEEDVSVLKEDGIIKSLLGSDKEVADIFNQLCKGITEDNRSNFHSALSQAKQYYESPWRKLIRRVKEAYCSKPLYWVSILAATAILVMTAVQMAYAIKNG